MIKLALLDWDATLVKWDDSFRTQIRTDILRNCSNIISPVILDRVQNDFSTLIEEARQYARKNELNPKSVTILFDYLFIHVRESKRSALIQQTQKTYQEEAAKKLILYPGSLQQLQRLKEQGYTLVVINNQSEINMHIKYQAVI
jgi:FMN phosphatase YigB (HAD superfamily)